MLQDTARQAADIGALAPALAPASPSRRSRLRDDELTAAVRVRDYWANRHARPTLPAVNAQAANVPERESSRAG